MRPRKQAVYVCVSAGPEEASSILWNTYKVTCSKIQRDPGFGLDGGGMGCTLGCGTPQRTLLASPDPVRAWGTT